MKSNRPLTDTMAVADPHAPEPLNQIQWFNKSGTTA